MTTVRVEFGPRAYDVRIGGGLLSRAGAAIATAVRNRRIAVIGDENVSGHVATVLASLSDAGFDGKAVILPPGEGSKSWATLESLLDELLTFGVARGDHVVAVGGGVIGDLTGFAAAILKRGVGAVQIPTTLLAQVDSSVGGKTGINTRHGKNLVGAFHQPSLVLIDPDVLDTLPEREVRAGYAEVVKYGLIDDPEFFAWCEANGAKLLAGDAAAREYAITRSVAAKARIVAADEHETSGLRALLNLGHTFGHALEAEMGYDGRLLHGEAVAAGMAQAFAFSAERGVCQAEDAARVAAHLKSVGLPTNALDAGVMADGATLAGHMRHDKKVVDGRTAFVLTRGIGRAFVDATVDLFDVAGFLDRTAK